MGSYSPDLIKENCNLLQQLTSVILSDEVRCRRETGPIVDDNEIASEFYIRKQRQIGASGCGPLVSRRIVETMYARGL